MALNDEEKNELRQRPNCACVVCLFHLSATVSSPFHLSAQGFPGLLLALAFVGTFATLFYMRPVTDDGWHWLWVYFWSDNSHATFLSNSASLSCSVVLAGRGRARWCSS